jgi:hypothetical protein
MIFPNVKKNIKMVFPIVAHPNPGDDDMKDLEFALCQKAFK